MARVAEIYKVLDTLLPRSLSCDWDNDGLMVCPDPEEEVHAVLFALDITPAVVEYAVKTGVQLIISHHPLIFSGIRRMDGIDAVSKKVLTLVRHGIAAMSFHTRLDAAEGGINDLLAARLGLSDIRRFGPDGEQIGRIGSLPEQMPLDAFCRLVKEKLGAPAVFAADAGHPFLRRVALLGGAGKEFLASAQASGADVFLTGEIGYNHILDVTEMGLSVVTAGHYDTEALFSAFFLRHLGERFPELLFCEYPNGSDILCF